MRPRHPWLLLALLAATPAAADDPHPLPPEPAHTAAITAEEYLWQDAWLSCDARKGRDTGSPECHEAALWIAGRMEAMGLEAPEKAPGHLQPWVLPGGIPDPAGCALSVVREGADPVPFALDKGFVVLAGSSAAEVEAPVVFAGYGIRAEEKDLAYDDFAGVDCKGKVVLVFRHEPREKDAKSRWNGDRLTRHSFFPFKVQAAKAAGAAALVVMNDLLNHDTDPLDSSGPGSQREEGLPVLLASRAFTGEVLRGSGWTQEGLQRSIDEKDAPASRPIPGVRVRVKTTLRHLVAENVVGMLRGSDPALREEWVVVGAHYDHVGLGYGGGIDPRRYGEIHNGADDNASGTAAMLEAAESFALGKDRPRRSLLFLAFSGEEKGLLGSQRFVADPAVPVDRMVAMVNLDMVGRYRPGQFDVVGAESGSTLREIAAKAAGGLDLEVNFTNAGMANSDGFSFYSAKVPTLFLFTGLHDDYHRPGDDWWLINAEGGARVSTMAARVARALADADGRPEYRPLDPSGFGMGRRNRVIMGVTLQDGKAGSGAGILEVTAKSPADLAGVKAGDRVVRLGDREVKDGSGFREALARVRPGDTIPVRVLRGEEALDLKVSFPGPRGPVFGVVYDATPDGEKGALVQEVAKGSVAEAAGLKPGDRILSFGGREVAEGSKLAEALATAKAGDTLAVKVLREGRELALQAAFPKSPP